MFLLGRSGLVAAYVVIALLLAALLLYTPWSWKTKALMVVVVSAFYLVSYFSLPPPLGWPTSAELTKRFKLVAIYVVEPDKTTGAEGEIFLRATDMASGPRGTEPRVSRTVQRRAPREGRRGRQQDAQGPATAR